MYKDEDSMGMNIVWAVVDGQRNYQTGLLLKEKKEGKTWMEGVRNAMGQRKMKDDDWKDHEAGSQDAKND